MTTPHTNGSRKNGHDHSHAQPYHSPGNGKQHKENQSLDAALGHQFDFDGAQIRVVTDGGTPWFFAADVCRGLQIATSKGVGSALRNLDADEKRQVSRAKFFSATP